VRFHILRLIYVFRLTESPYMLSVLFGGAGALAYLTFGSDIQTTVIINLNLDSKAVQTVSTVHTTSQP
jgi:solute carrier family 36 (proton-coupled amino acid transporter)